MKENSDASGEAVSLDDEGAGGPTVVVDTDEWVHINQCHYDPETNGELTTELVFVIADAKDVDPLDHGEMPPLYESVDAAALEETFFGPSGTGARRDETGVVTFTYHGYLVAVQSDGWISVYEPR